VLGVAFVVLLLAAAVSDYFVGRVMQWLTTNLILAAVGPVGVTALCGARHRRAWWWAGAVVTLLMVPNTPYVLTDVIHVAASRRGAMWVGLPEWQVYAAYLFVFAAGVVGYAYVMARVVAEVRRHHDKPAAAGALAILNAVCAAGVWLGRVPHINSWDVVRPDVLASVVPRAVTLHALADMLVVFVGAGAAAAGLLWVVATATRFVPSRGGTGA
jgi:uncharacterized membrane protein